MAIDSVYEPAPSWSALLTHVPALVPPGAVVEIAQDVERQRAFAHSVGRHGDQPAMIDDPPVTVTEDAPLRVAVVTTRASVKLVWVTPDRAPVAVTL